jgi:hypothetical protein
MMHDYDVWYHGRVIGNVKADTNRAAVKLAKLIYGDRVTAKRS